MAIYDLHVHTSASDGMYSPAEIVAMAERLGVDVIALTDHDTVAGIPEAVRAATKCAVRVIPGVEISTDSDGVQAHILGYFVDYTSQPFVQGLERFAEARLERAHCIMDRLGDLGISLPREQLCDEGQTGAIGRPHIARLMMRQGYVGSVEEAFCRYLNHGQKAYVPRAKVTPAEAIGMIHRAGGTAVLAHPWSVLFLLDPLVADGLDGLEVYYRDYDTCQHRRLSRLAHEHGLLCTGGTDLHGPGPEALPLGGVRIPRECLEAMDARRAIETDSVNRGAT
jgi:predicted metal-dependent phosphoesterase TrpH